MKVYFKGSVSSFAALIAEFVKQGLLFETKWLCGNDEIEGQAEIIFTGGF